MSSDAPGSPPTAQVVLAGGEDCRCGQDGPIAGVQPDPVAIGFDRADDLAAPDLDAAFGRLAQQPLVEPPTREAPGRERQRCAGGKLSRRDRHASNRHSTQRGRQQIERGELADGFAAKELAADLIVRAGLALEQHYPLAAQREAGGGRRPGETAAGDGHVPAHAAATVRKRIASAVSPGPKASAQPGRAGPRPASSRASTNMTVAELMLP